MAQITPQQAGGVNIVAFLDMLAWPEGADNGRQATKDRGYVVTVGGQLFSGYADQGLVVVPYGDSNFAQMGAAYNLAAVRSTATIQFLDRTKDVNGLLANPPYGADVLAALPVHDNGVGAEAVHALRHDVGADQGNGVGVRRPGHHA
ncbi:lysozyme [Stenotrophomonas sp. TWI700]|uniref:lysozyme n=1 Tax=Stenotrophomonas sp. TWI700 TaxID=3136792 RepID=UPI00320A3CD9